MIPSTVLGTKQALRTLEEGRNGGRKVGEETGDSIPGSGRSPGEGTGDLHQYSCLENLMDGGAWWAMVLGVAGSDTI